MTATIPAVRNAEGAALFALLEEQQARKIDAIVPAEKMKFVEGQLVISGMEHQITEDGVTDPNGTYDPTTMFDSHLAERLEMNGTAYLRQLREGGGPRRRTPRLDIYDANVNGLLHGRKGKVAFASRIEQAAIEEQVTAGDTSITIDGIEWTAASGATVWYRTIREEIAPDSRSFMVRMIRGDVTGTGIARALLSDSYSRMDNFDGFLAMMQGIEEAGIDPTTLKITGDITERRMYVHVAAPQIAALAPDLLHGYRSPFDQNGGEAVRRQTRGLTIEERMAAGQAFRDTHPRWNGTNGTGDGHRFYDLGEEPIVHAGFTLTNSEVGDGRWTITPGITVLRCSNGLTMVKEAYGKTHVGGKQDEGVIAWSEDTNNKELAFVKAKTRDVVVRALTTDYVEATVRTLEEKAGRPIAHAEKTIEMLSQKLSFSPEERAGIQAHFFMGGQQTSGGVMQAITSYSQTVADADAAHDLNNKAIEAMELAFSAR